MSTTNPMKKINAWVFLYGGSNEQKIMDEDSIYLKKPKPRPHPFAYGILGNTALWKPTKITIILPNK